MLKQQQQPTRARVFYRVFKKLDLKGIECFLRAEIFLNTNSIF